MPPTNPDAQAVAPQPQYTSLIDPKDNRIYSVRSQDAAQYRQAGWGVPNIQPTVRRQEIDQTLSSWQDYANGAIMQVVGGVPFATTVLQKTISRGDFERLARQRAMMSEQHPIASALLAGAGGIAAISAGGAVAGAVGGALGIGAGIAEGAGIAAEAAEAAGVGARVAGAAGEATAAGAEAAAGVGETATNALARMGRNQFGEAGRVRDFIPKNPATRSLVPYEGAIEGAAEAPASTALQRAQTFTHGPAEAAFEGGSEAAAGSEAATAAGETGMVRYQAPLEGTLEEGERIFYQHAAKPKALAEHVTDAEYLDPAQLLLGEAPRVFYGGAGKAAAGAAEAAAEAAAGLGAEAAGLGAEGVATGAEAAAGAAEGAGLGAEGAAAEGAGAGTAEAAAAKSGPLDAAKAAFTKALPAKSAARLAVTGAVGNTALGQIYRIDNAAIEHAMDPSGQEKLTFSANDILLDAALGAAIPLGARGLGKVFGKTGKSIEGNAIGMFRKAMTESTSVDGIARQGRLGDLWRKIDPLIGLSNAEIYHKVSTDRDLAAQAMEFIKHRHENLFLSNAQKAQILEDIAPIFDMERNPISNEVKKAFMKKSFSLHDLQNLGKRLRNPKKIVWNGSFEPDSLNARSRDAYNRIAAVGAELLETRGVNGAEDAVQWKALNREFSDNSLVIDALKNKNDNGLADFGSRVFSAAVGGAGMATLGVAGGTIAGAAARTASWSVVHHVKGEHIAPLAYKLGKGFQAVDKKIGNAIEAGLYGVPSQVHKFTNPLRFDDTAATVALAAANPAKAIEKLQTVMANQGIPQEIAIPIVQKQVAGLAHLHKSRPVRNDIGDMATQSQGDPVQNLRWLDQVRTFKDPTYGLSHPTADNLKILKQFYPEILFNAQQAAHLALQKDPNLPLESRIYASKLLDRPISNLTSPTFAQALAHAKQAQDAPAAQTTPSGPNSRSNVQSSLTRADALQNRE